MPSYNLPAPHRRSTYSAVAISLHWLVAAAILAQLLLGWWMLDVPKAPPGVRAGWFNLHKSVGLCIALAVMIRLAWRATHGVDDAAGLPRWQRRAARVSHWMLYACTAALPVTGLLGSLFTRYPVRFFGMPLPAWNHDWPAGKEAMSLAHVSLVWVLMALIALHVAAALRHWWRGDGVTRRMGLQPIRHRTSGHAR